MKKTLFAIFLLSIVMLLPFYVYADQRMYASDTNGQHWESAKFMEKTAYIAGFIVGSSMVARNNLRDVDKDYSWDKAQDVVMSYLAPDPKKPKNTFSHKEVSLVIMNERTTDNYDLMRYDLSGMTLGQFVDGLNALYKDFRNKQIKVYDAVYVVKKQIKGGSAEEVEAILQYLRSNKDASKLFYLDKDGARKLAYFP